ncbi:MAG: sigma-70 family RNA polymerase sigma factor [Bacteroidetes bacterium]|nr:sigma-70 family RNA polymerase sigma factor [Bacteroidota bacterium]
MENKEATARIFKLIEQLPANQKTVLILNKIEQKSINEIAEILNMSYKAIESLLQRAKTNLALKLKSNEGY